MCVLKYTELFKINERTWMQQKHTDTRTNKHSLWDSIAMVLVVTDILTVSVTINWCVFCFNLVPRIRILIVQKPCFRNFKRLINICRWYRQTPLVLARIVTEQIIVWFLVLLSLTAMFATDVIKHPFRGETSGLLPPIFIQTVLGINIGKYVFVLMQDLFLFHLSERLRFRAELIHHVVTVVCYSLFLAYNQNVLLGLIGILMETTTVFDSVGRCLKEQDKRNTKHYRRLVLSSCAMTICFRGIIPLAFLIIATMQQTPFSMDYAPLTVFFLSIIFFSVVNVWLILTGFQRLVKLFGEKSQNFPSDFRESDRPRFGADGRPVPHSSARRLELSKNNLGYVRPYENKNISNNENEKSNLNNHKMFPKETLNNHIAINILLPNDKSASENKSSALDASNRSSDTSSDNVIFSNSSRSNLRESGESASSDNSSRVFFSPPALGSMEQNNLVAFYARRTDSRVGVLPRSLSMEDVSHNRDCQDNSLSSGAASIL